MNQGQSIAEKFDWNLANEYIEKAEREGRTADDGYWDYLETLGIPRPEETAAFLKRAREENSKLTRQIRDYLEQMRQIVRAAQQKYAGV